MNLQILFTSFLALILLGCSTYEPTPAVQKKEPLHVAMSTNYPPLAFKENDVIKGIEVDLARLLAMELNRDLIIDESEWKQLPMLLENQYVDIVMSGISITKKRSKMVLFTEPFMKVSQMALLKEGTQAPNSATLGMGKRIGYSKYTTGELFVKEAFSLADHKAYKNLRFGIAALLNGEIDYFFHDSPAIWHYSTQNSIAGLMGWYVPYTQEHIAWALNSDDLKLKHRIDAVILKWQGDGTFRKVFNKWIPSRASLLRRGKLITFE